MCWRGYRSLWVHFGIARFPVGDSDGVRRHAGSGRTESAAGQSAFLCEHIGLAMFSAGRTLGLKCGSRTAAAPDCAKETSLPGLSSCDSRCGCVLRGEGLARTTVPCANAAITATLEPAHPRRAEPGYNEDPAESNLCSAGSCCISMLPIRTIGDLPNSNLWFGKSCNVARQQVGAGTACRLSPRGRRASARSAFCARGCAAKSRCCRSLRR